MDLACIKNKNELLTDQYGSLIEDYYFTFYTTFFQPLAQQKCHNGIV
jgi:hypothetical protein